MVIHTPQLSRSTEDYLKAIYQLAADTGAAQTSAIAEALAIAPPSVTGMVKRLSESGLLEHTPYHGVQLTAAGRRACFSSSQMWMTARSTCGIRAAGVPVRGENEKTCRWVRSQSSTRASVF